MRWRLGWLPMKYIAARPCKIRISGALLPPPTRLRGHHARHHQQPSIGPAFETHLLIGGHLPRHPWGGMVLRWRSSRESRLILSSEVATRNVCLVRANYSIEESLWDELLPPPARTLSAELTA